jgi:DNA-binding MarR family transcriptional regulator
MSEDGARELRDALRELVLAHGVLDAHRRPCGTPLPLPTAHALLDLLAAPEGLTVTDLGARLRIDRTNVSRLCERLVSAGWCARGPHPRDRRARLIHLTQAGRHLAEQVDAASRGHHARLLTALGSDAAPVVRALQQLERAIRALPDPPPELA